jgi:hypothetical protein
MPCRPTVHRQARAACVASKNTADGGCHFLRTMPVCFARSPFALGFSAPIVQADMRLPSLVSSLGFSMLLVWLKKYAYFFNRMSLFSNDYGAMYRRSIIYRLLIYNMFALEMNVFGFVFSFWDVLMFSLVAGIVFSFIGRVFNDE